MQIRKGKVLKEVKSHGNEITTCELQELEKEVETYP